MQSKKTGNNNRVYFISNNVDEDLTKIKQALITDNISFIEKVFKSTINNSSTTFINININTELDEETFKKVSMKFNKILKKSYKMFIKIN